MKLKRSKVPITFINTRDCFAFDLVVRETILNYEDLKFVEGEGTRMGVVKTEYFFEPDNLPENYNLFITEEKRALFKRNPKARRSAFNYPVGITCFNNFFSQTELIAIERQVEATEEKCKNRAFLPMTAQ